MTSRNLILDSIAVVTDRMMMNKNSNFTNYNERTLLPPNERNIPKSSHRLVEVSTEISHPRLVCHTTKTMENFRSTPKGIQHTQTESSPRKETIFRSCFQSTQLKN